MTTQQLKNVCVFCGSKSGTTPDFKAHADVLVKEFITHGIGLVYGGGTVGIMGVLAKGIIEAGGKVEGIIPQALAPREISSEMIGNVTYVNDMHTRKLLMYRKSDAFIALPGGFGTLDELLEVITWVQLGIHTKTIGILNTRGYFDPLLKMVENGVEYGFIDAQLAKDVLVVSTDPIELLQKMMDHKPPVGLVKWASESDI
jgi:uncharacterized protein (TIGR00730 family)